MHYLMPFEMMLLRLTMLRFGGAMGAIVKLAKQVLNLTSSKPSSMRQLKKTTGEKLQSTRSNDHAEIFSQSTQFQWKEIGVRAATLLYRAQ
mmetsp:Transcript_46785/g.79773  ORF Transcript_46785/g.79773 Transcript_46785/m.79773 type:complete len:91 (+) Transcript_46785:434-706(+)